METLNFPSKLFAFTAVDNKDELEEVDQFQNLSDITKYTSSQSQTTSCNTPKVVKWFVKV